MTEIKLNEMEKSLLILNENELEKIENIIKKLKKNKENQKKQKAIEFSTKLKNLIDEANEKGIEIKIYDGDLEAFDPKNDEFYPLRGTDISVYNNKVYIEPRL